MENRPYRFYYEGRYKTHQLLTKFIHSLDSQDEIKYIAQIGEYLYEFRVQDRYSSWKVLKNRYQTQLLLQVITQKKQLKHDRKNANRFLTFGFFARKETINTIQFLDQQFQLTVLRVGEFEVLHEEVIKFFQIYHINVQKVTAFQVFKKVRGLTWVKKWSNWCCGAEWELKRIIITSQGVLQIQDDGTVTDFLKFDLYFSITEGIFATGQQFGIALRSAQRKIVVKALNVKQFVSFLYYTIKTSQANKQNITYSGSCHRSSVNSIQFIVDAENYYDQVANSLQKAKRHIFICGWWISPELYLKRPLVTDKKDYWRLDQILKRKAEEGVKIYIIVFLAPSVIPNDSTYTKKALTSLHPNILVERHPSQILPKLWSHHEKLVLIDQKIALMGGLDLCYGRFDSQSHPINVNTKQMYPGIDYNNVRIKDFMQVSRHDRDLQDRNLPRMPWHDVAFKVTGKMVVDAANHFVEYWNYSVLEKQIAPIVSKGKQVSDTAKQNLQKNTASSANLIKQQKQVLGQLLKFASQKETKRIQDYMENKSKRQKILKALRAEWMRNRFQLNNSPTDNYLILSVEGLNLLKQDKFTKQQNKRIMVDQLQMLRSASEWSIGLEEGAIQRSIQNAYLSMIKNAKNFIYIQNQFFISATGEKDSFVQNQIANSLYERIKKAIQKKQKFRVVIFMPLLPGMQGQLTQSCPLSLKLTMFWQYNTISQCEQGLIPRIAKLTPHPEDYIQFYSLRNHGILNNIPVTQLIYIHTKLIIVDDHIVLCGSANINDRSQQGDRDSELAVIFTNGQKAVKKMNNKPYQINRKAHQLRAKLFKQHFGMNQRQAQDPLSDSTINMMRNIAKTNTQIYRQVFGCCPDDNVKKLSETKNFQKISGPEMLAKYQKLSPNIQGHAVQFPTQFLSQQKLFRLDLNKIQDIFT